MCYNCGCQRPDDPMGKGHAGAESQGKSITNKTFKAAAEVFGMDEKEAKKNTLELLKRVLEEEK